MNEIVKILGMSLPKWINKSTSGSNTVVELGAGFFKNLRDVHPSVKHKIGIEVYMMESKTHPSERGWDVSDH